MPEPERTEAGYLSAPDLVSARAIARLEDELVEVIGERTESSSTYVMPNGNGVTQSGSGPVWVPRGGDGSKVEDWAAVDLTLVAAEDGSVRPVAQVADLVLAGETAAGTKPVALASVTDPETGVRSSLEWTGDLPVPVLEGNRATYEAVEPGVDLVVEATSTGFQQFLVASDKAAAARAIELPLTVTTEGAELAATADGGLEMRVPSGEVVALSATPQAWDATVDGALDKPVLEAPEADVDRTARLAPLPELKVLEVKKASQDPKAPAVDEVPAPSRSQAPPTDLEADPLAQAITLEQSVDVIEPTKAQVSLDGVQAMLDDPATTYPVVIDPSIVLAMGFDTYIQSDSSVDASGRYYMHLGTYNGGAVKAQSFATFPTAAIAGKDVLWADLELFNFHSYSCEARPWQVWHVGAVNTATRWTSPPGWISHQATSWQTAGGGGCAGAFVYADVSGIMGWTATNGHGNLTLGFRAENENDTYAWKKFYQADNGAWVPTVTVAWNDPPNTPSGLKVSPGPGTSGAWTVSKTPTLSATISDPDGNKVHGMFEVATIPGTVIHSQNVLYLASGSVAQITVPAGKLAEGTAYKFRVKSSDDRREGPWSGWHEFGIDSLAPASPLVTSLDYPADNKWHKDANSSGNFTFTMPSPDATVTGYRWGLNKAPVTTLPTTSGAAATVAVVPDKVGRHTLQVQAVDRSGQLSGQITKYTFYVGKAGILTPEDGSRIARRARIEVGWNGVSPETAYTHIKYEWRRGPDSGAGIAIDPGALTSSTGAPLAFASGWTSLPAVGKYVNWDAMMSAGFDGGPVQVRAILATSSAGGNPTETQWVTLTIDKDADGAAADSIGPGSVNLLTGDYSLSVTDAEEFGLSMVRSTSSRDTDSGYQLQTDRLSATQQDGSTLAGINDATASVTVDTSRYHAGGSSFKVMPTLQTTATYAHVGGGEGAIRLGFVPGQTYRISGWIYVPAASGLSPAYPQGNAISFTSKTSSGYSDPVATGQITPRPTKVDTWQQVSVDVTVPAGATEAFIRLFNGNAGGSNKPVYFDDLSVRQIWAPFGKEWATGTVDGYAGTAYTKIATPYDDVAAVHLTGGGEVWFTKGNGEQWFPEPGAEDLRLEKVSASQWKLSEIDGTVTLFTRPGTTGDFPVLTSAPPAATGQSRHVYKPTNGVERLTRIIAPIEPGVDGWVNLTSGNLEACTSTTPARGCEVMDLDYATSTTATAAVAGDFAGQVKGASVWTWNGTAVVKVPITAYKYNVKGQLVEARDPRIEAAGAPALVTKYAYDTAGRLTTVTAPGEEPYSFTYGPGGASKTGSGDLIDAGPGRLLSVTRASLTPGTKDQLGPDNTTTVVYNVPLTRAKGGPYDLNAAALATWAQSDGPSDATAVFGPQDVPAVTTATDTVPGKDGYKPATVHYLNSSGREVNTASPAGKNAPAEGFIDTAEYDRFGNTVRTLDATNRLLALRKLPNAAAMLTDWGLDNKTSLELSTLLDARSTYSPDGLDVLTETGPVQRLAVANDPNNVRLLRPRTLNLYDEGNPEGAAAHLITTSTSAGIDPFATVADVLIDPIVTKNEYTPIDGKPALDATSGWVHKQATRITVDAGQPTALSSVVLYDARGRAIESRKPGSTGNDAATVKSIFYSAGTEAPDARCQNKPEWAGQPCLTFAGGPVTGHDPARMSADLTVKRTEAYNGFGSPTVISESTGAGAGLVTRTTTTTYDAADRVTGVQIAGNTAAAGATIAKTTTTYDGPTGDVVKNASVNASGAETASVVKEYDRLGRLIKYTDANGGWTKSEYDRYGQPTKVTDSIGTTRSYEYDRAADPRGYVTKLTDSVAGTITPTWGADGQLESQALPGGVTLTMTYDTALVPVARSYTRTSDGTVIAADSVVENHRGQWITHTTPTSIRNYSYDRLGRLTSVNDTSGATNQCTTRTYGFDNHTNRTSFTTATATAGGACPGTTGATTITSTYDTADRLVSTTEPGGNTWAYDQLGRITTMPTENGTKTATTSYFVNDLVATQEVPGTKRTQWGLDPLMRFDTQDTFEWVNNAWANSTETVNHYDGDSDEPSWIVNDATLPDNLTRYVEGMDGALAVQTGKTGERVLQLVDLHGDITATLPIADGATAATFTELRFTSFDEFGIPQPMTSGATSNAPPARYGWLGAAQRNADTPTGVILMGVRLYHPATGRFLSVDPVPGGSANNYDYCNADPINCTDLGGTWTWNGLAKKIAVVGEIASIIPGPIGAAAAGISAVAYAASGNKGKALMMAGTIVASAVGAGLAIGAVKAVRIAKAAAPAVKEMIAVSKSNRALFSESKKWASIYRSKAFGAKSRLFGDYQTGNGAKAGSWNRGRVQVGWSGVRVARIAGLSKKKASVARTVFRIAIKNKEGKTKVHLDLGYGPFRQR
ncbi:tRNA nuclease WapA precursor [Oerskovia enterophila]|uniref:tRNA nuclease WapA n=1 Tax=Oerskovia enterophila TaxID=43678 RepID=A0ABX2XZW4_9CELL|nr:tRNA nuclease WapA precursor [Oerskovia enterophila]